MQRLKIGVAGLGRGFTVMLPTFRHDPRVTLAAAAEPREEARLRFAAEFNARAYDSVEALCADPAIDVVYVGTPHQFHAEHAALAAKAGKHVLVEKPMAITLAECQAMIAAARAAKVQLIVGHSHSFNAPVALARALIESGEHGAVRMINAFNYTDFVYRPRRPEEFDTAQGGGVVFSQGAHQVDIVRILIGSAITSVRASVGVWDASRQMDGAYAAWLGFKSGAAASLTYSGYGHFDTDLFQDWIGEMGQKKRWGPAARQTFSSSAEETAFKQSRNYGGENFRESTTVPDAHQNFGTIIVSCEHADLRLMPNGVMVYRNGHGMLEALPPPATPRVEVIDELYEAVVNAVAPKHSGEWARATLEVCLAMLQSSRENREIRLGTK
jgi:phthalate 4,5-cis-dihydrodiol dehydrogenase